MNLPDLGVLAKYRTISMIVIGLIAAGIAWVVIFIGYLSNVGFDWSDKNKSFAHNATFLLWLLLILAQAAAYPLIIVVAAGKIREIQEYAKGNWGEVVLVALLSSLATIALALIAVVGPDLPKWLPGYKWKLGILSVIAVAVAIVPAVGMWKAQSALRQVLDDVSTGSPEKVHIDRLLHLKDALTLFLLLIGTQLTLAVFAAAAERQAIEAYGKLGNPKYKVDDVFPTHYVTLYGLLLSVIVAIAYTPAHVTLRAVGARLRDTIVPMVEPSDMDAWQKRLDERKAFEDLLDLEANAGTNLKTAIIVLTPLLASLTGLLGDS